MSLDPNTRRLIQMALAEDLGSRGDVTTKSFLPNNARFKAKLLFKQDGILCGRPVFDAVCRAVSKKIKVRWLAKEGARLKAGTIAARLSGPRELLTAERTALNFIQKLSGMATLTAAYVQAARGSKTGIYDTRKTLPGWRALSKYAVRVGGGGNHRMGLYDMAMIKDNHLAGMPSERAQALMRAFRKKYRGVKVQIEAANSREADRALALGADLILLDNMSPAQLKAEIRRLKKRAPKVPLEISGGVDLSTVGKLSRLGADRISVGKLTHSAPALDISLKLVF